MQNAGLLENGVTASPSVRSLKIQPKVKVNGSKWKRFPEITLSGNWLAELGFQCGQRVSITGTKELLIIRLIGADEVGNCP